MSHEPLLTSVVGSHAHPGWFAHGLAAAERGEFGPADLAELLDDGVALAIRDQEEAGIDVVTDGEMRRAGFFTAEFYRHLSGVRPLPPDRRLGVGAHDALHRFAVDAPIVAPNGLGVVAEFQAARGRTDRRALDRKRDLVAEMVEMSRAELREDRMERREDWRGARADHRW